MTRYRQNESWLEARVEDQMLLMHDTTGHFVSLNDSGAFLWACLSEQRDVETLKDLLHAEFDVTEAQARADIEQWIDAMLKRDVLIADTD